jgi:hypothetical protein
MTEKRAMLVCVLPDLERDIVKRFLFNVAVFAKRVDLEVHLLNFGGSADLHTMLGTLPHRETRGLKMTSHSIAEDWQSEVVEEAATLYGCDLVVLPFGGISQVPSRGRINLLERTSNPIMLLSSAVNLNKTPIRSILVPMSGEIRASSALKFGLRLAKRIHVPVDLVHVVIADGRTDSPLETTGDQPHHVYRDLLDRVLAEASPFSDVRERAQVRTLYDVQGWPAPEILKAVKKTPSCSVVAEWHGSLIHGKAETLKDLLHDFSMPIFLVKAETEQKSVLKIGPETRVA